MENLNAEQIIKAFEVCRDKDLCNECPYEENIDCLRLREKHAIALMKSQEQRIGAQDMTISELRQRAEKAEHDADRYARKINELTEDNEAKDETITNLLATIADIQAGTVRKFAERLKAETITIQDHTGKLGSVVLVGTIDQIAKEMLESDDG
jgi:uncharacterized protein YoxC